MIYLLTVGGLFATISTVVFLLWNFIIASIFKLSSVNLLEALGLSSFAYILFFGIKFGLKNGSDKTSSSSTSKIQKSDIKAVLFAKSISDNLNDKEMQELIKSIAKTVEHTQITNYNLN